MSLRRSAGVFCIVTIALLAALPLVPIAAGDGWRSNHEYNIFYARILIYAEHFKQGDWLPIWSSTDNLDFGSFQPSLYHKLFNFPAALLYVLIGNMKATLIISLWFWLTVGALGTYRLCRALECGKALSWCGAVLLLFANYTTTNWLIRGAMAEFSAAMVVPWALAIFVEWLTSEDERYRASVSLGLLIGFVFLAHSVLAFYLGLLLAVSALLMLLCRLLPLRRLMPLPLLAGGASFMLVAGPSIVGLWVIGRDYDMARILAPPYSPEYQFKPVIEYLWDTSYQWGKVWPDYTVQLDLSVMALLLLGLIALVANRSARFAAGRPVKALALSVVFLLALLLQTGWATLFYRTFPGAAYIQFPWRLLAIITPVAIALALWLWQRAPTWASVPLVAGALSVSVWQSGVWQPPNHFDAYVNERLPGGLWFSWAREYVPVKAGVETYKESDVVRMLGHAGCRIGRLPSATAAREEIERGYMLGCDRPGTYPLPLFGSALHRVGVGAPDGDPVWQHCAIVAEAPALCAVRLDQAGQYRIRVRMPTLGALMDR